MSMQQKLHKFVPFLLLDFMNFDKIQYICPWIEHKKERRLQYEECHR